MIDIVLKRLKMIEHVFFFSFSAEISRIFALGGLRVQDERLEGAVAPDQVLRRPQGWGEA